jgi:hypothetical protein
LNAVIRFASHSEVGSHPRNEDFCAVQPLPAGQDGFLCALADGQGGRAGGAQAAEVACRTCVDTASTYRPSDLLSPAAWGELLRQTDQAVCNDSAAGFTTLVVFCLTPEIVCGASCGDSAALLFGPSRRGKSLTAHQVKNPPVGSGDAVAVPYFVRLDAPWAVLAMSDGVWKYAGLENILNLDPVRPVEEMVAEVLAKARLPNGGLQDDFTLVAFQEAPECEAASGSKEP